MASGNETLLYFFVVAMSATALGIGWVLTQVIGKIFGAFRERNELRREAIIRRDAYQKSGQRMADAQEELKKEQERTKALRWAFAAEREELQSKIVDLSVELARRDKTIAILNAQIERKAPAAAGTATDA